jgi:hypothetical protein
MISPGILRQTAAFQEASLQTNYRRQERCVGGARGSASSWRPTASAKPTRRYAVCAGPFSGPTSTVKARMPALFAESSCFNQSARTFPRLAGGSSESVQPERKVVREIRCISGRKHGRKRNRPRGWCKGRRIALTILLLGDDAGRSANKSQRAAQVMDHLKLRFRRREEWDRR